jgi:hypothetical protein
VLELPVVGREPEELTSVVVANDGSDALLDVRFLIVEGLVDVAPVGPDMPPLLVHDRLRQRRRTQLERRDCERAHGDHGSSPTGSIGTTAQGRTWRGTTTWKVLVLR